VLEAVDLVVRFGEVTAVDGVSLRLPDGPFGLGLVGESGSGKTTIARAITRLVPLTAGDVLLDGRSVVGLGGGALRDFRRHVQIVFQDPTTTLDPRMRVGTTLAEVLRAHRVVPRKEVRGRVAELLADVGLESAHAGRFPHQLSGGQRQRVSIARALAVGPSVVVLDEPTSALDVTVQARVLELIRHLRQEHDLAYLLVSHNLAVVERLCERVAVLYQGIVVEEAPAEAVLREPLHPYTRALLAAVPDLDRRRRHRAPVAEAPAAAESPAAAGCRYHPRCGRATAECRSQRPVLRELRPGHLVACYHPVEGES
jgi:peptide/nickel transport system ATP-binding protein